MYIKSTFRIQFSNYLYVSDLQIKCKSDYFNGSNTPGMKFKMLYIPYCSRFVELILVNNDNDLKNYDYIKIQMCSLDNSLFFNCVLIILYSDNDAPHSLPKGADHAKLNQILAEIEQ